MEKRRKSIYTVDVFVDLFIWKVDVIIRIGYENETNFSDWTSVDGAESANQFTLTGCLRER